MVPTHGDDVVADFVAEGEVAGDGDEDVDGAGDADARDDHGQCAEG